MSEIYKNYITKFINSLDERQLKVIYLLAQKYWLGGASHE